MTVTIPVDALDAAIAAESFTGVVTIDVSDERRLERCEGYANRALGIRHTPRTRIAAASGNKGFTALAIMRLVETGLLKVTDRVRPILGDDLPLIDDAVIIGHLLTHTSGIGDYLDEEGDGEIDDYIFSLPLHLLAQTEAFLPALDGFPQKFPPGERFSYCNGGYVVLALVAERVSGRDSTSWSRPRSASGRASRGRPFCGPTSSRQTPRSGTSMPKAIAPTSSICRCAATVTAACTSPRTTCTGSGTHCSTAASFRTTRWPR